MKILRRVRFNCDGGLYFRVIAAGILRRWYTGNAAFRRFLFPCGSLAGSSVGARRICLTYLLYTV